MSIIKESAIRPNHMIKKMNQLRKDDMVIFKSNSFITVNCPSCNSKKYTFQFKKRSINS